MDSTSITPSGEIRTKHIRCKITGPARPAEFYQQEMFIAFHKNHPYLRVGNEIFEGRSRTNSCEGTNIHFSVDMHDLNRSSQSMEPSDLLTNYSVTNEEWFFWPVGAVENGTSHRPTNSRENAALKDFMDYMDISP